jgi:hypothetical protein
METDLATIQRAHLASRFADRDGRELAELLRAEWGTNETALAIAALKQSALRLSILARHCRLAAKLLRT